ncbi:hypothetical protein MishRS11D_22250 [Methylomagnum ishizawai]|nr:hypothetical protein MishRS11D_22250 [Methylomagnum ishizawai]
MDGPTRDLIAAAVQRGIQAYIESRRDKVPEFVERHFSLRGAWALHRATLGRDFYRHPLNMLWGLPWALTQGAAGLAGRMGADRAAAWLHRVPPGIPTRLDRELRWLLHTELLELPYADEGRESRHDALMETLLAQPEIAALCGEYLRILGDQADRPGFRAALETKLAEYGKTRAGVSELAGSLITLATGYAVSQQVTPGALSAGSAAAAVIAQQLAIANFWLGSTVGAWYYAVFPATASAGLVVATTGALLAAVGVLAALSWIVLDPLLAKTGLHRRRLLGFVDALGAQLAGGEGGDYRVRDHYIARVFDVLDVLRIAAGAAR